MLSIVTSGTLNYIAMLSGSGVLFKCGHRCRTYFKADELQIYVRKYKQRKEPS